MSIGLEVKKYNSMKKKVFLILAIFPMAATVCLNILIVLPGIKDPVSLLKFSRTWYVFFSFVLFVLWTGMVALFVWLEARLTKQKSMGTIILASIINAVALLWLLFSLILSAIGFSDNVGTIRISNAEELSYIRNYPSGAYVLTKDIDLEGKEWKSISKFKGSINGNGHSIINITVGENGFIKENLGEISLLTFSQVQYFSSLEEQHCLICGIPINAKHQYTMVSFSESSFWKIGYSKYVCELGGSHQYYSLRVDAFNWVCLLLIISITMSVFFLFCCESWIAKMSFYLAVCLLLEHFIVVFWQIELRCFLWSLFSTIITVVSADHIVPLWRVTKKERWVGIFWLIFGLIGLILNNYCGYHAGMLAEYRYDSVGSGSQTTKLDERDAQNLYNNYIEINNHMLGEVNDALTQYFSNVNMESEKFELVKENINNYSCYYPHSAQYLGYAEKAYEAASGKSEKDALDQSFLNLYPSLHKLIIILGEIHAYTDDDGFLKDNYANSQEQHTALMEVLDS